MKVNKNTKAYKNKIRYNMRYNSQNVKQYGLALNRETDADIIAHLENQPNKVGYLKALIRADMSKDL